MPIRDLWIIERHEKALALRGRHVPAEVAQ